jgi:hypothetical protein
MSSFNIADWITREISAGGRVVLIETFAGHGVVVVFRAGKLMVVLTPEPGSERKIIGVGVKLESQAGIDAAVPVQDQIAGKSVSTLLHHVIEVGTYQGTVSLSLCRSEHGAQRFTFDL